MEQLVWETAEELDQKLAQRVRKIRKRRSISQMKLASVSGVSYGSIKRFETTGQISLISLTKIAMALDIADELRNILHKCHIGIFRRLSMSETKTLQVMYDEKLVGTLAMASGHKVAFQYSEEWLEDGFQSAHFITFKNQVFVPQKDYFDGLFGVFADSLPDNWGRLLLNRLLRAHKQNPDRLTVLDRLEIVGKSGMGAITYHPERTLEQTNGNTNLDELAEQCQKILNTEYSDKLDELYRLGGTSGGARPKIMTTIDEEEWIIKFPAHVDGKMQGKWNMIIHVVRKKWDYNE